jgi:hypothetical protein
MDELTQLDAIRTRRESLYQAIIGLEDALTTPVGDGARWRLRVAMAIDHAALRINDHICDTERKDGFLDSVVADEPRLRRRVDQLRVDHERLAREVDVLRTAITAVEDDEVVSRVPALRNQAVDLLGQLVRHRERGADLIYELYQVDLGGTGSAA